ncbi:PREDICTED: ACT domain-containing protein ACR9-like [Ipomoea nil]|uniref:ACT domain-containing protein ACR9-like n=1 Tax=Ipomoea nil TaxID=35883 RepID=UPI000900F823|nr:PREDICTED: ACT domain-containing protein ACR9-like [Ipomoea nil]
MPDDSVVIQNGNKPGDPYMITVNCLDKLGLGCEICRIILDFGLNIKKGDVSTDGRWCYVVMWVFPQSSTPIVTWAKLKDRLWSVCPPYSNLIYLPSPKTPATSSYLMTLYCIGRTGLLHDVTQFLCECELYIERVKVMTTPDDRVLDVFIIKDHLELLNIKEKQEELCEQLRAVLGESCISCELKLVAPGPLYENLPCFSALSPSVTNELFRCELSENETHLQELSPDVMKLKKSIVTIDNALSSAHTLIQISCVDYKSFLYDITRALKGCNVQITYARFSAANKGQRELDVFVQHKNGEKILDPEKQASLCYCLKVELLHPLRVVISNRGPDTELLVANPLELSGMGRPRVFYDVTFALKTLGICIFSAEIETHSAVNREWEVFRFLLDENCNFDLSTMVDKNHIVDRVRRTLMGW